MLLKNMCVFLVFCAVGFFCADLLAQDASIPLADKVADETAEMNVWQLGKYLIYGVAGLALAALSLAGIITSGNAALHAFNDWRIGKAEIGELVVKVIVALVVLVVVMLLVGWGYESISDVSSSGSSGPF